jgi:cyclopropane fatty-acyl-phospholipid synthase-like methyltransferase
MASLYRGYARQFRSANRMDPAEFAQADVAYATIYDPFLPSDRTAGVLDLGCGGGHFLHYVKGRGFANHLGVERDSELAAAVKATVTPHVVNADLFTFLGTAKAGGWSVVALNDVLEHFGKEDGVRLLEMIRKVLPDDGRVLIKTINMSSPFATRSRYADLTHESGYTEESLGALLGVAGLRPLHIGPEGHANLNRRMRLAFSPFYRISDAKLPRVLTLNVVCVAAK